MRKQLQKLKLENTKKAVPASETEAVQLQKLKLWFDGCCEPVNPGGHSSFGIVIMNGETALLRESGYCGHGPGSSNNVAEYSGFVRGLEFLIENKLTKYEIHVRGDSNLVIQQMFGTWRIKKGLYVPFAHKAKKLLKKFKNIYGEWIPREENGICDCLSKQVLIDKNIKFRIQPNE